MWELTNSSTCIPSMLSVNFKMCSLLSSYFIVISLSINVILGLPANCYILWLSVKEIIQGQSTEIFIFNTALAEIIFCGSYVFVIPHNFFNCTECELGVVFLGLVLVVGRPLFQTCICVERYLGVIYPVTFLKLKPMKYRIIISVIGWILTICSCTLATMNILALPNDFARISYFFQHKTIHLLDGPEGSAASWTWWWCQEEEWSEPG